MADPEGVPWKGCLRKYYYIHHSHIGPTHFSFSTCVNSCIKNSMCAWPTCTYILPEARGNHRVKQVIMSELKFIRALLGMAICYQYERIYITSSFAASVAKWSHTFILRASNPTTRFSSRLSNFIQRIHQK